MLIREIEKKIEFVNNLEVVHGRTRASKKFIDDCLLEIESLKEGVKIKRMTPTEFFSTVKQIEPHKMSEKEYNLLTNLF